MMITAALIARLTFVALQPHCLGCRLTFITQTGHERPLGAIRSSQFFHVDYHLGFLLGLSWCFPVVSVLHRLRFENR